VEKELIALLKTHDQKALKSIFEQYHSALCALAFSMIKDKDQSKDIVQDVFIKLWKNRLTLEISTSLQAYLKRATINTALNFMASRKDNLRELNVNIRSTNAVDQEIAFRELQQGADNAIKNLPVRTRAVFTLIRSEEMSYKQVAITLAISEKAVEKEMMKALRLLREALKEYLPSIVIITANIFS
jgi:RNA polymerase sigma-70 factor (ECF subfamily)